jgi:EAL domain-containing protein (putative c-di-GMP-specific phosphodiesterase class I)/CHASE2 domain-containing sensor protein
MQARGGKEGGGADRWWSAVPLLAIATGLAMLFAGWGGGLDRMLRESRDQLRMHPASGQIGVVEIDARSLRSLDQWPWPRRHHAALVDRLIAGGAGLIAFDVNFEVQSNPQDDAAFASALERAGGLVALPTFEQCEVEGCSDPIETLPFSPFRDHVFLAGVNVAADVDGLVRRLPLGTFTSGTPRPSMAALLAESLGDIDEMLEIDFAIDPASIPRFSFIDVIEGRVDPARLAGKRLIIGGTAADMEDRYAVPLHGVLPGVVVQAMAAETIISGGVPASASGLWPLLIALLAAIGAAWPGRIRHRVAALAVGTVAVLALPLATEQWLAITFPVAPALVSLVLAAAGAVALHVRIRYWHRSLIDPETDLPNLKAMRLVLGQAGDQVVMVARIDRFEALAAALGPGSSVALVQRVAERLAKDCAEPIYRAAPDCLAWAQAPDADRVEQQLGAIAAAMRGPVDCGRPVDVTIGIGIADAPLADEPRQSAEQQIANAALAAERALRDRRPFLHFAEAADEASGWHLSLLSELSEAMRAGEVWNAYQPKLDLATGEICGVETLARWTHRERGPVGPDRFIPIVEAHGRAEELTAHVLRQALADAERWHAMGHRLSVAVNISATLLEDRGFIAWLADALRASPVDPGTITLEVTEAAAVKDVDQAAAALQEWRALGVVISIDDYGTGQSSLGYLQRLPAGELKIDKSFVQNLVEDQRDVIMVRSTVALAHQLGMKVVAEGVEDEATLALLKAAECDVAQGWLIGRPMAAEQLETFLASGSRLAA